MLMLALFFSEDVSTFSFLPFIRNLYAQQKKYRMTLLFTVMLVFVQTRWRQWWNSRYISIPEGNINGLQYLSSRCLRISSSNHSCQVPRCGNILALRIGFLGREFGIHSRLASCNGGSEDTRFAQTLNN